MSAPAPTPPSGVDLRKWGPDLLPIGTMYVFKGVRHMVPKDWKNPRAMMKHLKYTEQLEWKLALPEQRQEVFNRQLAILTKDLPINWEIVSCYVVSGIIICVAVYSRVKSHIAKL